MQQINKFLFNSRGNPVLEHIQPIINNYLFRRIAEKLVAIEEKQSKKAIKTISTRAQQVLLLQQMGFFENKFLKG